MKQRLPPLESLRVFEVSARHLNLARAAEELRVTPSAVSLRIRELEQTLGRKLFTRNGPRISLTRPGAALAARLSEIMERLHAAVAECKGSVPTLRVTAAPTVASPWLAQRLLDRQAESSGVEIELDVSTELRPAGGFDVAIRSGDGAWPGLVATPLLPILFTPMLSPSLAAKTPLTQPSDLAAIPLLLDEFWPNWLRLAGLPDLDVRYSRLRLPTQAMLAEAAMDGAGVALLSPIVFADYVASGALVRPFDQVGRSGGAFFAVRSASDQRPSVTEFIAWLKNEADALCQRASHEIGRAAA